MIYNRDDVDECVCIAYLCLLKKPRPQSRDFISVRCFIDLRTQIASIKFDTIALVGGVCLNTLYFAKLSISFLSAFSTNEKCICASSGESMSSPPQSLTISIAHIKTSRVVKGPLTSKDYSFDCQGEEPFSSSCCH